MTPLAIDDDRDTDPDRLDGDDVSPLPGRPRLRPFNRITVPLLAVLLVAVGFLVGIEVEKGRGPGATSSGGLTSRSAFPGASGAASRSGSSRSFARGFGTRSGFGGSSGLPSGDFGGGAGGAGGGTAGTISSISGNTIDLKTTSGNTITVSLTSATSLKKVGSVTRNAIRPGDSITVTGISGAGGSIKAASISDSGHASTSSG